MSKEDEVSFAGLDCAEEALSSVGLILSGVVFAAGLAALLFVIMRIIATSPPSFRSPGEWLYAAMASFW